MLQTLKTAYSTTIDLANDWAGAAKPATAALMIGAGVALSGCGQSGGSLYDQGPTSPRLAEQTDEWSGVPSNCVQVSRRFGQCSDGSLVRVRRVSPVMGGLIPNTLRIQWGTNDRGYFRPTDGAYVTTQSIPQGCWLVQDAEIINLAGSRQAETKKVVVGQMIGMSPAYCQFESAVWGSFGDFVSGLRQVATAPIASNTITFVMEYYSVGGQKLDRQEFNDIEVIGRGTSGSKRFGICLQEYAGYGRRGGRGYSYRFMDRVFEIPPGMIVVEDCGGAMGLNTFRNFQHPREAAQWYTPASGGGYRLRR
ncbi:MAG: hypothetical protein KGQ41_07220 [Alphaproteobacteria bacterium]|nr:hypothetical protein [Alphaproteobacteria bacterium]